MRMRLLLVAATATVLVAAGIAGSARAGDPPVPGEAPATAFQVVRGGKAVVMRLRPPKAKAALSLGMPESELVAAVPDLKRDGGVLKAQVDVDEDGGYELTVEMDKDGARDITVSQGVGSYVLGDLVEAIKKELPKMKCKESRKGRFSSFCTYSEAGIEVSVVSEEMNSHGDEMLTVTVKSAAHKSARAHK